jgi:recombination protein RecR
MLPASLKNLIDQLSKLPEIGPRAATRLVFFMLNQPDSYLKELSKAIAELKQKTKTCKNCFNLTSDTLCNICADTKRNSDTICVVEDALDIIPIERTKRYQGLYHILGGLIAPIEGITPDKLRFHELIERIKRLQKQLPEAGPLAIEIVIALNPTTEGDTTALYLERVLKPLNMNLALPAHGRVKITRLGRGLSTGSDLEYADETTLINALQNRR